MSLLFVKDVRKRVIWDIDMELSVSETGQNRVAVAAMSLSLPLPRLMNEVGLQHSDASGGKSVRLLISEAAHFTFNFHTSRMQRQSKVSPENSIKNLLKLSR